MMNSDCLGLGTSWEASEIILKSIAQKLPTEIKDLLYQGDYLTSLKAKISSSSCFSNATQCLSHLLAYQQCRPAEEIMISTLVITSILSWDLFSLSCQCRYMVIIKSLLWIGLLLMLSCNQNRHLAFLLSSPPTDCESNSFKIWNLHWQLSF